MVNRYNPLEEYTWTVAETHKNRGSMEIGTAIDKAPDEMPDDFMIGPFLQANRVVVKKMPLTEYNETETMALFMEEGREANLPENIRSMMKGLKLTARQVMDVSLQLERVCRVPGDPGQAEGVPQ